MNLNAHKVMLLGEIGVGKSSIAQRLVFDRFEASYKPTIGVDVYRYDLQNSTGGKPIRLILWDSDGNLGDAIFKHIYLKEASAAIIIGDVTRAETINAMPQIARSFRDRLPGRCVTFIVNKMDLARDEPSELPEDLNKASMPLFRTSALSGDNVRQAFEATAAAVVRAAR